MGEIININMGEIININIGQAAVRIGHLFWTKLREQHKIDSQQPTGNLTFFQQKSRGFESRCLFVHLDQRQLDKLTLHSSHNYNQFDLISTNATSKGTYAESAYTIYPQLSDEILDRIRRKVQACQNLSGFMYFSSMGGGTSSGLGNKISQEVRTMYPDKVAQSFKLLPDIPNAHPLEIYNCAHSIYRQVQNSDLSLLYDNSWAERLALRQGIGRKIQGVNLWVADSIAESTIPFRFSGQLNTSQRKIATNLVLFPRMHFLPFANAPTLTAALKPDAISLTNFYAKDDKSFGVYTGVRDNVCSEQQADNTLRRQLQRHHVSFVEWLPHSSHQSLHQPITRPSATFMINSYNMSQYFNILSQRFTATYRRKGFECWYTGVGLDSMEFTELQSNLNDLASEYTPYAYYDGEDEMGSQEGEFPQ